MIWFSFGLNSYCFSVALKPPGEWPAGAEAGGLIVPGDVVTFSSAAGIRTSPYHDLGVLPVLIAPRGQVKGITRKTSGDWGSERPGWRFCLDGWLCSRATRVAVLGNAVG